MSVQDCDKFHGPSGLTPPGCRKDIPGGLLTSLSVVKRRLHTLVGENFLLNILEPVIALDIIVESIGINK